MHFKDIKVFGNNEIMLFYKEFEANIKPSTVNWRVYSLVQSGILSRIGRGKFTLGEEKVFIPQITPKIKKVYNSIHKQFPFLQTCIWNTIVLNEFMLHQLGRFYTLVEVEKDSMESVFYFLKEKNKNIFLDPSADILSRYSSGEYETIIIKSLVSEAPTQKIQNVETTTIEKLLVDIFTDEIIFAAQQGSEMQFIFKTAFDKYTINENRMLRYADRKRKKEALDIYLNKVSKFRQQTK
ncbi:MAG: DUF6577 family protein [Chitinophagales bacterium]